MTGTYCGKSCDDCSYKRDLACAGCKEAKSVSSACPIARCCRSSHRESCEQCPGSSRCASLGRKNSVPKDRLNQLRLQQEELSAARHRAGALAPRIYALFVLSIPFVVLWPLSTNVAMHYLPGLYPGASLAAGVVFFLMGIVLLTIPESPSRYRPAGVCLLAGAGGAITACMHSSFWVTLFAALCFFAGDLLAFSSHGNTLRDTDESLSEQWETLAKWRMIVHVDIICTAVLHVFSNVSPMFFALVKTCTLALLVPLYLFRIIEGSREEPEEDPVPVPANSRGIHYLRSSIRLKYAGSLSLLILLTAFGLLSWLNVLVSLVTSAFTALLYLTSANRLRNFADSGKEVL